MERNNNIIWDKIGHDIDKQDSIETILSKSGMDFEVESGKMYVSFIPENSIVERLLTGYKISDKDGNHIKNIKHKGAEVPGIYATYRTDTYDVLGVVGSRYEIVQNREVIEFFINIINNLDIDEKDVIIRKAGILYKGAQIFLIAELPGYKIGEDDIEKYLVFMSSHDGSKSIMVCFTDIRICCSNAINIVFSSAKNRISCKHTQNVRNVMNIAENIIHESTEYSKFIKKQLEYFQTITLSESEICYLTASLIWNDKQVDYLEKLGYDFKQVNRDIISSKSINKYNDIIRTIYLGIGQETGIYDNTLYWWYNGITSYINNYMSYKSEEDRFSSIFDGSSSKLSQKAYNLCVEFVNLMRD